MSSSSELIINSLELVQAARRLADGGLVAFPTETVYGLGADAQNPMAVQRIFAAKGRPLNHPLIVHLAPEAKIGYWVRSVPDEARLLIKAFWPGPLTLILPRADHIPSAVSGGQDSIGLRCPSHPVAQALLRQFAKLKPNGEGGVAAPSANKFGQVSPTCSTHVLSEFSDLSSDELMVLDGGQSQVGIESTIVDLSRLDQGVGAVLLRPGYISAEQIQDVLGFKLSSPDRAAPRVSGSLKAHYAPRTPLALLAAQDLLPYLRTRQAQRISPTSHGTQQVGSSQNIGRRIAVVAFKTPDVSLADVDWVVASSDAKVYARELYALLRRLDQGGYAQIVFEQPVQEPDWLAVNDRLGRAAAAFS